MSWVPAFKVGLWNAWIPMLYFIFHPLIMLLMDKAVGTGGILKRMGDVPNTKEEKRINDIYMVALVILVAYSIFLPLKLGTGWFYAGLVIYLVGLVMFLVAVVNVAKTPAGQPFTRGMYRFSRNPMYLSFFITFMGVGIASASWVFLSLSGVIMVLQTIYISFEEQSCIELYGKEYKEYMNKTPRWLGMPKSR